MASDKKTLWLLSYEEYGWSRLRPVYAEDQTEAWNKALVYAREQHIMLPSTATLHHYPHGFDTCIPQYRSDQMRELQGEQQENRLTQET